MFYAKEYVTLWIIYQALGLNLKASGMLFMVHGKQREPSIFCQSHISFLRDLCSCSKISHNQTVRWNSPSCCARAAIDFIAISLQHSRKLPIMLISRGDFCVPTAWFFSPSILWLRAARWIWWQSLSDAVKWLNPATNYEQCFTLQLNTMTKTSRRRITVF